jgi:glutathione S-transferase
VKLMHGKVSPFVRKVMICAIEKGLDRQIEVVPAAVGQGKINEELLGLNPTGKIPTLITNEGQSIYDSLVICDYLDSLATEPRFVPTDASDRTSALTMNAVGDGLVVAGVLAMLERSKVAERQWPEFETAQWAKVQHCIAALDVFRVQRGASFDIGAVGAVCGLGWLDARARHVQWRTQYPQLAAWFDAMHERESVAATRPPVA